MHQHALREITIFSTFQIENVSNNKFLLICTRVSSVFSIHSQHSFSLSLCQLGNLPQVEILRISSKLLMSNADANKGTEINAKCCKWINFLFGIALCINYGYIESRFLVVWLRWVCLVPSLFQQNDKYMIKIRSSFFQQ